MDLINFIAHISPPIFVMIFSLMIKLWRQVLSLEKDIEELKKTCKDKK